eukprot:552290-Pelagomonas_calceolata.AAC.1
MKSRAYEVDLSRYLGPRDVLGYIESKGGMGAQTRNAEHLIDTFDVAVMNHFHRKENNVGSRVDELAGLTN